MKVYARITIHTRESLNWIMSEKLAVLKMNILLKLFSCIIWFIVHFLKLQLSASAAASSSAWLAIFAKQQRLIQFEYLFEFNQGWNSAKLLLWKNSLTDHLRLRFTSLGRALTNFKQHKSDLLPCESIEKFQGIDKRCLSFQLITRFFCLCLLCLCFLIIPP